MRIEMKISYDTESALKLLRGTGKPIAFVILAVQIAMSADDVGSLVSWGIGHTKPPTPLPPLPPVDDWLKMYRNHRTFNNEIGAAFGLTGDYSATDLQSELREFTRASHEEIKSEVNDMTREEQEAFLFMFRGMPFPPDDRTLRAMLDVESETDEEGGADKFDEILASTTGQFYIRVWLPCWILHHTYPQVLLREARLGNHDSLDKLLRLDKSVVSDPKIGAIWHEIIHNGTRSDKNRFKNAMADSPKARVSHKNLRIGLAGLISQVASLFQCRVTAPEITKLFDAISRVRYNRIDTALPPSPDAMKRAIQRNRNWPSLPPHSH